MKLISYCNKGMASIKKSINQQQKQTNKKTPNETKKQLSASLALGFIYFRMSNTKYLPIKDCLWDSEDKILSISYR